MPTRTSGCVASRLERQAVVAGEAEQLREELSGHPGARLVAAERGHGDREQRIDLEADRGEQDLLVERPQLAPARELVDRQLAVAGGALGGLGHPGLGELHGQLQMRIGGQRAGLVRARERGLEAQATQRRVEMRLAALQAVGSVAVLCSR